MLCCLDFIKDGKYHEESFNWQNWENSYSCISSKGNKHKIGNNLNEKKDVVSSICSCSFLRIFSVLQVKRVSPKTDR